MDSNRLFKIMKAKKNRKLVAKHKTQNYQLDVIETYKL